jgi:hypothetical protein
MQAPRKRGLFFFPAPARTELLLSDLPSTMNRRDVR